MVQTRISPDFPGDDPLTTALNAIPLAILVIDSTLKIRWINRTGETLFGRQGKILIGQSIKPVQGGLWTWSDGLNFDEAIGTLLPGGDPICGEEQRVTIHLDGKKTERHLRVTASPVEFAGDRMILMALEDITLLKALEKKDTETERLSHTIQMARGTAHELNQPLSVLVGNLDLLRKHHELDGSFRNRIDKISDSADRVAEVVRRLQMIIHSPKKRDILKTGTVDSERTSHVI